MYFQNDVIKNKTEILLIKNLFFSLHRSLTSNGIQQMEYGTFDGLQNLRFL